MDLLNMTNRVQIHEFYKKEIFIFQITVLKLGDLLAGWKLVINVGESDCGCVLHTATHDTS